MRKAFILVLFTFLSSYGIAQQNELRLVPDLISIVAKDIDKTSNWYQQNLGFTLFKEMNFPEYDSLKIVFLKKDSFMLEIITKRTVFDIKKYEPHYNKFMDPRITGFNKLAFRVNEIEKLYESLEKKQVSILMKLREDKVFMLENFMVEDPDGNLVQFVQPIK